MIKYQKYRYIFPPRPENKIPSSELEKYDNNLYIGQPKLDGSNLTVYTDGDEVILMNRHKDTLYNVLLPKEYFRKLHRGNGWIAINGEYMNKSKKDTKGEVFNHKFVIFDILVYNGKQTVGKTFKERTELLAELYETTKHDDFIEKINENIFVVKNFFGTFVNVYNKLTKTDMYEGLVLKKMNQKLKNGVSKINNVGGQLKCRKETKNYRF
jgi:ATP-dependent DNA ligase